MRRTMLLPAALIAATAAACAGSADYGTGDGTTDVGGDGASASDAGVGNQCLSSSECPTGYVCTDFGQCQLPSVPAGDGGVVTPPETEYEYGAPVSSNRYVYVAMTAQDELARIDGATLGVKSTGVGEAPRVASAIPGSDGAVVLDATNGTATVVRPTGDTDRTRVLPTLRHLNRLDIDPSGRFAVVWFDLTKAIADGGLSGIGSFQDVTVIALADGVERAVNLAVGFRPRAVEFDATGSRAYVITEDGVSVVDLGYATTHPPALVPPIPVAAPGVPPADLEVHIVATGQYAVVRQAGFAGLRVVDVDGVAIGQSWEIPLASAPTDLDFAPDGRRVYAVEREAKQLAVVDIPGDAFDPSGVERVDLAGTAIGSLTVSADGRRGLLYTNATLDERITLLRLDAPGIPHVTWPLKKAVRAIGLSPTGTSAIIIHAKAPGNPATATSVDDYIDKSYGYSMLDLATGFAKLEVTPVDPGPFVYAPDGTKAYIALDGGDVPTAPRALEIVETATGVVNVVALGSPPSAVGILPGAGTAFVSQRHPLGRVSFVDLATNAIRTVTGFDLNGGIVN